MTAPARSPDDFIARVRRTIERRALFKRGDRVLVAVSGGPDSLAMLHALARLAPSLGLDLHVGHFDHRLREGSAQDARFVEDQAARLEIPCTLGVAATTERARGESPEEAARNKRMRFLAETASTLGASRIATGHTLDDQAETVLMNLFFGAGRRGLGAIPPRTWWHVRPLIDVRRADTEAFCTALGLEPRHDPTNDSDAFLRNVVRHQVIPQLESTLDARLSESLARTADVLRDEDFFLDRITAELAQPEQTTDDASRFDLARFAALDPAVQRRAIRIAARTFYVGLTFEQCEAVRALALEGRTGNSIDLPGPLNARTEYGFLVVGRARLPHERPDDPVTLIVPGATDRGHVSIRSWFTTERPDAYPDGRGAAVFDADRIAFPLRVRRWRAGDRFRPFGMSGGEKKVGDFFTDRKVPREERQDVDVVAGDDGGVIWIVGHAVDDRVKVTDATRRLLWIEID